MPIVTALNAAMRKATASKQMIDSLAKFGTEPTYMATSADFTAWIRRSRAGGRW